MSRGGRGEGRIFSYFFSSAVRAGSRGAKREIMIPHIFHLSYFFLTFYFFYQMCISS